MTTKKNHSFSEFLISFGGGLAAGSVLLLWGGLFGLELSDAPSFGFVRIQDILCIVGMGMVLAGILVRGRVSYKFNFYFLLFFGWIVYGIIIGILNNTPFDSIGYEARAQIYALFGAIVGSILSKNKIRFLLLSTAVIMALAILIQWALILSGSDIFLVSGGSLGNVFTLNLPLVRPVGGSHLVAAGMFLALNPWSQGTLLISTILAVAVIGGQSKAYWLLSLLALFLGSLAKGRSRIFAVIKNGMVGLLAILLAMVIFNFVGSKSNVTVSPFQKFTILFDNSEVKNGVLGERWSELNYTFLSMKKNPYSILFGHGLGYSYRSPDLLFYRADPTGAQRLSMYVHSYPVWVLLKYGLAGLCFIFVLLVFVYQGMRKGDIYQKQFGFVLGLLLIGSITSGTFQDPTTAFLLGLLAAAAGRTSLLVLK